MNRLLRIQHDEEEGELDPHTTLNYHIVIPTFNLNDNPSLADGVKRLNCFIDMDDNLEEIREVLSSLTLVLACTKHKNKIEDIYNWNLNRGGVINCILNDDGHTPLFKAIQYGLLETTRCLLNEYGANVTISNHYGLTPLHYAVHSNPQSIALTQLLLDHGGYKQTTH